MKEEKKYAHKTSCFAYTIKDKEPQCSALTELVCSHCDVCHFYKHRSEVDQDKINKEMATYIALHSGYQKKNKDEVYD